MKSRQQRITEFVQYHKHGDGECNNVVLRRWADEHALNTQERYELAFLFSATYCVLSALVLFKELKHSGKLSCEYLLCEKPGLIFQSDRKYMAMKNNFIDCMDCWQSQHFRHEDFMEKVYENGAISQQKAIKFITKWTMYGRFAAFLFLETFVFLTGFAIENASIDWKHGDTATSGLLNVFGYDDQADMFDKRSILRFKPSEMDEMLIYLRRIIAAENAHDNVTEIETSLCAYRKFYKGSRYNGYYLDRMLEELMAKKDMYQAEVYEILSIRQKCFDKKYLGEASGWNGIRKPLKKLYRETGVIT